MHYQDILAHIIDSLHKGSRPCAVVAAPYSSQVLKTVKQALDNGFVGDVVLVGDPQQMPEEAHEFVIEALVEPREIAESAARKAKVERGVLIKGTIASSTLLRAALSGEKQKPVANHVYIIESRGFPEQTLFFADAGVNINPDVDTKRQIIHNTLTMARQLTFEHPRVALISAVETLNPHIQSTVDAVELKAMGQRGEFGSADIDGPMALDAALIASSAKTKKLSGPVAGKANVLILSDIDSANSTAKALIGVDGDAMGVVVGGAIPIAFPSRGDSEKTRYHSLLLAAYLAKF
jgi:phosphotransacetylase